MEVLNRVSARLTLDFGLQNVPVFSQFKENPVSNITDLLIRELKASNFWSQFELSNQLTFLKPCLEKVAIFLWRLKQLLLFSRKALSPSKFKFMESGKIHFILGRTFNEIDNDHFIKIGQSCCGPNENYVVEGGKGKFRSCVTKREYDYNEGVEYRIKVESAQMNVFFLNYLLNASFGHPDFQRIPFDQFMAGGCDMVPHICPDAPNKDFEVFLGQFKPFVQQRLGHFADDFPRMGTHTSVIENRKVGNRWPNRVLARNRTRSDLVVKEKRSRTKSPTTFPDISKKPRLQEQEYCTVNQMCYYPFSHTSAFVVGGTTMSEEDEINYSCVSQPTTNETCSSSSSQDSNDSDFLRLMHWPVNYV